ncbi:MAG: hypothetical protein NVS4B2_20770 [Chloroflexota bacterium]
MIGWLVTLGLAAALPLSAIFRGIVHVGTAPLIVTHPTGKPILSLGSDVVLPHGSGALVVAVLGNVHIAGPASDDVVALDGRVYLNRRARVRGDVLSVLGAIYMEQGARVDQRIGGAVHVWNGQALPRQRNVAAAALQNVRLGLAAGLALLLVGTCLVVVFPWQVVLIASTLREAPYKSFAAGIMSILVFLFLIVPLGLSLAGLPFALLLASAAFLAWLFGLCAIAVIAGRRLARGAVSLVWASATGLLVLALGMAVPFVGPLLVTGAGLIGAGALAVALVGRSQPLTPLR